MTGGMEFHAENKRRIKRKIKKLFFLGRGSAGESIKQRRKRGKW